MAAGRGAAGRGAAAGGPAAGGRGAGGSHGGRRWGPRGRKRRGARGGSGGQTAGRGGDGYAKLALSQAARSLTLLFGWRRRGGRPGSRRGARGADRRGGAEATRRGEGEAGGGGARGRDKPREKTEPEGSEGAPLRKSGGAKCWGSRGDRYAKLALSQAAHSLALTIGLARGTRGGSGQPMGGQAGQPRGSRSD